MNMMSDATGTIIIEANNHETIEELKKCFEITSKWWCEISCPKLKGKKILESSVAEISSGDLKYYVMCNFYGVGSGSFSATLEIFQDWLGEKVLPHNSLLLNSEFKIIFKYVDISSTQNFIYDSRRVIVHTLKGLSDCCDYEFRYSYSLVTKAQLLGHHLEEVIADELKDKNDLEIFSILEKNKGNIEEYTRKLLEVYLYEQGLDHYAEVYNENIPFADKKL